MTSVPIYNNGHIQILRSKSLLQKLRDEPTMVAQLDARPTGDQEVAGSTPHHVGNILSWRLIMKYFLRSFYSSADLRRAVVSFWRKNVHNTG